MTKQEYLDEVCRLVSLAATEMGAIDKALDWLHDADSLITHVWLDDRKKCLQILDLSPNWLSFFVCVQDGCIANVQDEAESFDEMLEQLACSAMFSDCEEIINRVLQADAEIESAEERLAEVAKRHGFDFAIPVGKAREGFEKRTPVKIEVNVTEECCTIEEDICPNCGGIRKGCPTSEELEEAINGELDGEAQVKVTGSTN
ncbi:MAG: hypothetical protein ACE5F6_00200 [Anaerolineae bacterium]